jgi:chromosome segregation ATPase
MVEDSLKLFIKHKKIEVDNISAKILSKNSQLEQFNYTIKKLERKNLELEKEEVGFIAQLVQIKNIISKNIEKIKYLEEEIKRVEKEIDKLKEELKEKNAEKKGLEKMVEKLQATKEKEIRVKENNLANESFLHKFTNS